LSQRCDALQRRDTCLRFSELLMNARDFAFAFVPACLRLPFANPWQPLARGRGPGIATPLVLGSRPASLAGKEEERCGPFAHLTSRSN
jgi:hypothetical protein